jgi:hypothetical protein
MLRLVINVLYIYAFFFYRESPVCESSQEKQLQNDSTQQLQLLDIPSIDRSSPDGQEFEQLLLLPPHHHQARVASKSHLLCRDEKTFKVFLVKCSSYYLTIITIVKIFTQTVGKRKQGS